MKTICGCILNVLKETVPVSKPAKRKLLAYKKSLIALAEKSTPLKKKKKILVEQGGNFLTVLLPPVLRVLSSILTENESYQAHDTRPWKKIGTITTTSTNIITTRDTNSEKLVQWNERHFIQQATGRWSKGHTL